MSGGRGIVIVPAFEESANIAAVLADLRAGAPDFDVLVIDDGSSDGTADLARSAGARVVVHPYNLGYGTALQTGYRYAMRHGYDVLVQFDADGQHDGACVADLVEPIRTGAADLVLGSRFFEGSRYRMPVLRRLGSAWFAILVRWLAGVRVSDPTSGLQAMSRQVIELYSGDVFPSDYPDADMLVLLAHNGFRIGEVPVVMHERRDSPSMHSGVRVIYYIYKMTLAMLMNTIRPPLGSRTTGGST